MIPEEAHEEHIEGTVWQEAVSVVSDPGHLVAEFAFETTFLVLTLLVNWLILKYRDKKHGHKS